MYEYKCSNEACEHIWSIKEGNINSMYLTCPVCKKGRGQFIRQIKNQLVHADIKELDDTKIEDDYVEPAVEGDKAESKAEGAVKEEVKEIKANVKERKKKIHEPQVKAEEIEKVEEEPEKPQEIEEKVEAKVEEHVEEKAKKRASKKAEKKASHIIIDEEPEEDIFTRIRRKREMEEKLKHECENGDIDILEVTANTLEEIEKRIKEFEEYYYIKILDKNIKKQGKRYNCIIKYSRK